MIRIIANFVSKFPNFRYHGKKDRFKKIPMSLLRIFSGVMSGLCLGACMPNLMFKHLAILQILTVNAQKWGHVTLTRPPLRKFLSGVMLGL